MLSYINLAYEMSPLVWYHQLYCYVEIHIVPFTHDPITIIFITCTPHKKFHHFFSLKADFCYFYIVYISYMPFQSVGILWSMLWKWSQCTHTHSIHSQFCNTAPLSTWGACHENDCDVTYKHRKLWEAMFLCPYICLMYIGNFPSIAYYVPWKFLLINIIENMLEFVKYGPIMPHYCDIQR